MTNTIINTTDDARACERGLEIATRFTVTHSGDLWVVPHPPSRSFTCRVILSDDPAECRCTCQEFAETGRPCCHVHAARYARMREAGQPLPSPCYPDDVPAGAPTWVTRELIRETLRIWQVEYRDRLTVDDALDILLTVSRLDDVERQ